MEKELTENVKKELRRCLRIAKTLKAKGQDFWDIRVRFKQKLTFEECCDLNSRLTEIFPPKRKPIVEYKKVLL